MKKEGGCKGRWVEPQDGMGAGMPCNDEVRTTPRRPKYKE